MISTQEQDRPGKSCLRNAGVVCRTVTNFLTGNSHATIQRSGHLHGLGRLPLRCNMADPPRGVEINSYRRSHWFACSNSFGLLDPLYFLWYRASRSSHYDRIRRDYDHGRGPGSVDTGPTSSQDQPDKGA